MCVSEDYHQKELWRTRFPTIITVPLSIFQMILTLAILGCEIGGDFVNFPQMNVFLGYWVLPLFMGAWISLAGASCCCRNRCCGITTLVFQCLAISMALCVIGFDDYFLKNPTQCFFSNDCTSYSYTYDSGYNYLNTSTLYNIKVPLIRGQLAAGVLMLVSCVVFVIIFVIISYRVRKATQLYNGSSVPVIVVPPPVQNAPLFMNSTYGTPLGINPVNQTDVDPPINELGVPPYNPHVETSTNYSTSPQNQLVCPNCQTRFEIARQNK